MWNEEARDKCKKVRHKEAKMIPERRECRSFYCRQPQQIVNGNR